MWRAIELILGIRMARLLYVWCQVDQFSALQKEARFQHGSWDLIKSEVLLYLFQQFIWKPSFKAERRGDLPLFSVGQSELGWSGGSRCQEGMMMTFLSLFFEKRNNYFPEFLHSNWDEPRKDLLQLIWTDGMSLYSIESGDSYTKCPWTSRFVKERDIAADAAKHSAYESMSYDSTFIDVTRHLFWNYKKLTCIDLPFFHLFEQNFELSKLSNFMCFLYINILD